MTLHDRLAAAAGPRTYQQIVLEQVKKGAVLAEWRPLTWSREGHTITIDVLAVPLAVIDDETVGGRPVYVMASATLQQLIADELGALLPTPLVLDEMWRQAALKIDTGSSTDWERPWYKDDSLGTPAHMVEQSDAITKAVWRTPGIVAMPWKTWCLVSWLADGALLEGSEQACNHGLYTMAGNTVTKGGFHAIQVEGGRHGRLEIDYSQVVLLMMGACLVDGVLKQTADVLRDPELSKVLAYDGPLAVVRQPGTLGKSSFEAQ